ncbi:MAG: hypothetical protein Ct9H90mP18_05490 [Gammaproteobacteria bacterium]|nr:MAG: hypothetical protein Ct9H90mP18_05490 [Gammaproteobacteria bacterium]
MTDKTGSQCIVAAVDAKKESAERWAVYTHGGRKKTELNALSWCIDLEKRGAGEIFLQVWIKMVLKKVLILIY